MLELGLNNRLWGTRVELSNARTESKRTELFRTRTTSPIPVSVERHGVGDSDEAHAARERLASVGTFGGKDSQ